MVLQQAVIVRDWSWHFPVFDWSWHVYDATRPWSHNAEQQANDKKKNDTEQKDDNRQITPGYLLAINLPARLPRGIC